MCVSICYDKGLHPSQNYKEGDPNNRPAFGQPKMTRDVNNVLILNNDFDK